MNNSNTNPNNTNTNNTIGREAARLMALWLAERKEVTYARPGELARLVVRGYQTFGSGGYSADGRVIGPHTEEVRKEASNGFVTQTYVCVRGGHGAVAVSTEADALGSWSPGAGGVRHWGARILWLAGLPAEPERPTGDPAAWRAYHRAANARERYLLALPEVLDALWRASNPVAARALDARLAATADRAARETDFDALEGAPAALRILDRMRRAARRNLSHQPGLVRAPFDSTARAVLAARAALGGDAELDEVCAAVAANIAAEEAFVAALIAAEAAERAAERAAWEARQPPIKQLADKRPVPRL